MQISQTPSLIHSYGALGLNETLALASGKGEIVCMSSNGTYLFAGTTGTSIVRIDLSDFKELSSLTLSYDGIMDTILDETYLYVLHYNKAISRVRLADFTLVDSLPITLGDSLWSLAIDGTYLYASSATLPGSIVRVNLLTFTEIDAFTPGADVLLTTNLYTDGFYLYAAAQILPGSDVILKISVATFTQVDRIDNLGNIAASSNLTSDGINLYAISYESPGVVYQIDFLTFTIVKVLTFSASDTWPRDSFFNGTFLFVGCSLTGTGRVVVIDVATLSIVTTIILNSVGTADAIFSDRTYLYIGTSDSPGKIFRTYIIPTLDFSQKKIDLTNISVQSVISATTSAGLATTLVDTSRIESDDYWNNMTLLILGGDYKGQSRRITDFDAATDTITVSPAFNGIIASGVRYAILPTVSSLSVTDILSDSTPFAGADIALIKGYVDTLETDVATLKQQSVTNVSMMEFWSNSIDIIILDTTTNNVDLPFVVVANIPANTTIIKVVGMLKCRALNNTSLLVNAINGASVINIKKSSGVWGIDDVPLINIPNNIWSTAASTKEGGMLIEGNIDAKTEVDGNATYNFIFINNIYVDGNNLELIDVMVGLKVYFIST